jgi:hypothetical protein
MGSAGLRRGGPAADPVIPLAGEPAEWPVGIALPVGATGMGGTPLRHGAFGSTRWYLRLAFLRSGSQPHSSVLSNRA